MGMLGKDVLRVAIRHGDSPIGTGKKIGFAKD
jgi:hypothetical protein